MQSAEGLCDHPGWNTYALDVNGEVNCFQGTAFFMAGVGLLTAWHCVEGAPSIDIYHSSNPAKVYSARVLRCDSDRDIAILDHDVPLTSFSELRISNRGVSQSDLVRAVGYPGFSTGDKINIRQGHVTSVFPRHSIRYIEVSAQLAQGISGGPLLDVNGMVVGQCHKGGPGEGRNLAVSISEVASV